MINVQISLAARVLAIGVITALMLIGTAMGEISRTGLVAEWHFDGDAIDSSGNGNHGSLVGDYTFTTDAAQVKALQLTGTSGSVDYPYKDSLEPATGVISVWVKIDTPQNSDIFKKFTDRWVRTNRICNCSVIGLRIQKDGAVQGFVANDDPTHPDNPWSLAVSPPNLVMPGKWHHLVLQWNGKMVSIFVNGILQAQTPYDPVPGTGLSYSGKNGFSLGVGTWWLSEPEFLHEFIGKLDEVRIYNRALSVEEIKALYEIGQIIIKSSPPGAEVLVDEVPRGTASPILTVYDVAHGSHNVKCRLSGYSDYETSVTVTAWWHCNC